MQAIQRRRINRETRERRVRLVEASSPNSDSHPPQGSSQPSRGSSRPSQGSSRPSQGSSRPPPVAISYRRDAGSSAEVYVSLAQLTALNQRQNTNASRHVTFETSAVSTEPDVRSKVWDNFCVMYIMHAGHTQCSTLTRTPTRLLSTHDGSGNRSWGGSSTAERQWRRGNSKES